NHKTPKNMREQKTENNFDNFFIFASFSQILLTSLYNLNTYFGSPPVDGVQRSS
ncbi:uncharacterized protein METZ01_LOCUS203312, partial [marine metagenome]